MVQKGDGTEVPSLTFSYGSLASSSTDLDLDSGWMKEKQAKMRRKGEVEAGKKLAQ